MANTVAIRNIIDGTERLTVHTYLASDGSSGELTDQIIIDVSALLPAASDMVIERIYGLIRGFTLIFEFDATTDVPFAAAPDGYPFDWDFKCFGGLADNSGAGKVGDVTVTTTGFTASGDAGFFVIEGRKRGTKN